MIDGCKCSNSPYMEEWMTQTDPPKKPVQLKKWMTGRYCRRRIVLKTSWRRLGSQNLLRWRRLQDIFKTCWKTRNVCWVVSSNKKEHYLKEWTTGSSILKKKYVVFTRIRCFKYILFKVAVFKNYSTLKEHQGYKYSESVALCGK